MSMFLLVAAGARAAIPAHEAVVEAVADTPSNRAYTVCVKQRAAGDGQCVWTLRVEEDVPGVLATRPFAALASDDGLRVAVVLRKKRNDRVIDELWRYHQQMNPDIAVPGTPANRALVTRGRIIASGYPLNFSGNLALNRFVISDGRKLQAIDDRGDALGALYEAQHGGALDLVARRGALSGFTESADGAAMQRLVVANLDTLDIDTYGLRGLDLRGELAWNLDRAWVAASDLPREDTAVAQARERIGTPTALKVIDLAYRRNLFETTRTHGDLQPAWTDADTLVWHVDENHLQSQQFDERSEIRLLQATVRAQGDRLMFLPCRERAALLVDDAASAPEVLTLLRQQLAHSDRVFVEAFGSRVGNGVSFDALAQAGNDANGCQLKADRAMLEASGSTPAWKLSIASGTLRLEIDGQPAIIAAAARLRRVDGHRIMTVRAPNLNLDLNAAPQMCRDASNTATQGWSIALKLTPPGRPGRELRGCARVLMPGMDETARLASR